MYTSHVANTDLTSPLPFFNFKKTTLDPNSNPGTLQRDGSPVEFGGNTPTGGKFAEKWDMHGWSADPEHSGPSGFKTKNQSFYDDRKDDDRKARIQKEVEKCTPSDDE